MNNIIKLKSLDLFLISNNTRSTYGANQEWYSTQWKRKAGCGPTACSHLMWYLSQTKPDCQSLCTYNGRQREGFTQLMEDLWDYVTPGPAGVNRTEIFTDGAHKYGHDKNIGLNHITIEIPSVLQKRPPWNDLKSFLKDAFIKDLPVAFLNLSNGSLKNLDSWHWVTLAGINTENDMVLMYDQGNAYYIDLKLWLKTSLQGGGFVVLSPGS